MKFSIGYSDLLERPWIYNQLVATYVEGIDYTSWARFRATESHSCRRRVAPGRTTGTVCHTLFLLCASVRLTRCTAW
jgi:hypothetical protein